MNDFLKGLAFTAIPIVVLCAIATVGSVQNILGLGFLWPVVWIAFLAAFILAIVMAVRGRKKASAGIFVGLAIGVIALGASCFAVVFSGLAG
jgi:hypothetical protein